MYICEGPRLRTALSSIYSWEVTVSGLLLTECTFTKDSVSGLLWTAPYRMYICEGPRLRTALSNKCMLGQVYDFGLIPTECTYAKDSVSGLLFQVCIIGKGTVSGLLLTECTFMKDSVSVLLWTAPY